MLHTAMLLGTLLLPAQDKKPQETKADTPPAESMRFKSLGFSIAQLETGPGEIGFIPLQMYLPGSEGFSPNVNVLIRKHPAGFEDYIKISKDEFERLKLNVISEKKDGDTWKAEYAGKFGTKELHFYASAVFAKEQVYLATGVSAESQWAKSGPAIKKCVDSFKKD